MCKDKYKHDLNRRDVLKGFAQYSAVAGAATMFGSRAFALPSSANADRSPNDPHYFLHINIPSGMDASYLFDARPLSMTKDGLIANYHGKDPIVYTGTNGVSTLRTTITDPLMKYQDRFSVINGVVMGTTVEGHEQLMSVLLTGNPFGGESFLPWASTQPMPLDYLVSGSRTLNATITNNGASMNLSADGCRELAKKINRVGGNERISSFVKSRAGMIGNGKSSLAASARRLATSTESVNEFSKRISAVHIPEENTPPSETNADRLVRETHSNMVMLTEFMRLGLTNTGVLILADSIDSHGAESAARLPEIFTGFCLAIAKVFDHLASVQSPSGRSMLDDTTFLIGSEFSRTMRQQGVAIDKTGTDHNPLTNTLIVGGKGVRGGLVVGESDFASSTESLSAAHLAADPAKLKIMGRPYDFDTDRVIVNPLSGAFDPTQYIGASNVTNALQDILGIPTAKRFTCGRNLPVARSLKAIIA